MDYSTLIGRKVVSSGFKGFGEGVIVAIVNEKICVDFSGNIKDFALESFFTGSVICHFECEDDTRALIQDAIEELKAAKAEAEAAKKAAAEVAKKVEAEKLAAEEAATKRGKIVGGFDTDYHAEYLNTDEVYTYQQVEAKFGIRIAGFGRGCNLTDDSIILISSVNPSSEHFVYHDKWTANGDYIFSGEGRIGDQRLTVRNKEIINAEKNGKVIHLIIKFSAEEYYYQGVFKLVDYSYEDDSDEDGNTRKEYKFRLRKV